MRTAQWFAVVLAIGGVAGGAELTFTAKPKITNAQGRTTVEFTVSRPADVEVAVLDAGGQVVRHLAAGVLGGPKPPPEPLRAGLSQAVAWDGRDDSGQAAGRGPLLVRVRAGTAVRFGRLIGGSPFTGCISNGAPHDSVAVDQDGTLYVKMGSFVPQLHQHVPWQLRKFDSSGKYVRTLLPYPPSMPAERASGIRLIDAGDGLLTPASLNPLDPALFYFGDNLHHRVVDGSVVFINSRTAELVFFRVDGSNAMKIVPMRSKPERLKWPEWLSPQVAFSPDGRYAYYANVAGTPYDGKQPSDIDPKFPQGRVYRHDLTTEGADPQPFFDLKLPDWQAAKYWMPSAWGKKSAAAGIDVDPQGNLWICDLVNQEVVEVSPQGRKLAATKVPWPDKVRVSRKGGAWYVLSQKVSRGYPPPATLVKLTGRGEQARQVATLTLEHVAGYSLALDESGDAAAIWIGGEKALLRVEDRGEELAVAGPGLINSDKDAVAFVCFGDVDRQADLVYVTEGMGRVWRYSGASGAGGLTPIKACDVAVGPGGLIYGWGDTGSYAGPVARYHRDFRPAPLAATGKHLYGSLYGRYGRGNNAPGMAVDARGWVYAVCGFNDCHLRVYDAEGKLVAFQHHVLFGEQAKTQVPVLIPHVNDQGGSVRVDRQGNVYVLEIGLPKGFVPPRGFEKEPAYLQAAGTIYKFTPKGGDFTHGPAGWEAVGAVAGYPGCAPISGSWNSTGSACHCTRPRFDVDPYGRLYVPNAVTYRVSVRDNAGNEILEFGGYGNFDAQGPESREPKPAIPLGWPIFAAAGDEHLYVGDCLNHRVVRVDKTFAAEETCAVP
jgi:DNA-binding beta-propeller fold protein YncE